MIMRGLAGLVLYCGGAMAQNSAIGTPPILPPVTDGANTNCQSTNLPSASLNTGAFVPVINSGGTMTAWCWSNGTLWVGGPTMDSSNNGVANSYTTSPGGNGKVCLPSTGGNSICLVATSSQQGGTLNPPANMNSLTYTVAALLSGTTASIGGSALSAGQCTSGTVTISGALTSMTVAVSPVADPGVGVSPPYGFVSATNTVTVRVCAMVAVTPAAVVYNERLLL